MKIALIPFLAIATISAAQTVCPPGTASCSVQEQTVGDTDNSSNASGSISHSNQSNPSSNSNVSGASVKGEYDNRSTVNQNSTNTTTGTISGGNTTSGATGGAATGNLSTNDNKSSSTNDNRSSVGNTTASTGASNSGGNTLGSSSGGNTMTGGANSAAGGAGGAGGSVAGSGNSKAQGGAGGSSKQGQGQGQQQGIDSSGNSRNAVSSTNRNGSDNTVGVGVDASDRSSVNVGGDHYVNRTIFIPAIIPPTPPSQLAVGNIVKETTACGPLQTVVKTPIEGTTIGFFVDGKTAQGYTYDLQDYKDANGNLITYSELPLADGSGYRMIGHQAIIFGAVIGTSNAKNIALGGGSSGGGWGQGGGGNSGAIQQLVTNIQLRACDLGTMKFVRESAAVVAPVVVPVPMPVIKATRE